MNLTTLSISEKNTPNIKSSLLYINHFSFEKNHLAIVKNISNNCIVLKISCKTKKICKDDSIICRYIFKQKEYILSGNVCDIVDEQTLKIIITELSKYEDLRKEKRYSVSLQAVIVLQDCLDFNCTSIKDISLNGLKINSKFKFELNTTLNLTVIIDRTNSINLKGKILRINKVNDYYEYGLLITTIEPEYYKKLTDFLTILEEIEINFFNDHILI